MIDRTNALVALALAVSAAACAPPHEPAPARDSSAPDAPAVSCEGLTLTSLDAPAYRTADGARYNGRTDGAMDAVVLDFPASCGFRGAHPRRFAYTLRSTAALRVSTDNPGTGAAFDTVLAAEALPCTSPPRALACNDDDPLAPAQPHVASSLLTTPALLAGTTVVLTVAGFVPPEGDSRARNPAGETGAFELTVREVPTVLPNAPCDPLGTSNSCPDGWLCLSPADRSAGPTCALLGAVPGAPCRAGACAAGLVCDASANLCVRTAAVGAPCDRAPSGATRCEATATCVGPARGAPRGVCRANGTEGAACATQGQCASAALVCAGGRCLRAPEGAPDGAPCDGFRTGCPTGFSCVASSPGAASGACAADGSAAGAACRSDGAGCDAGLFCIVDGPTGARSCRTADVAPGGACGPSAACAGDAACVAAEPPAAGAGVCTPPGALAGACGASLALCAAGLSCSSAGPMSHGLCFRSAAVGAPCDPSGRRVRCSAGARCVLESAGATCRADGTAAGAACRASEPRCDAGLACAMSSMPSVCVRDVAAGAPCDPRGRTVRCPGAQVCRASALNAGACADAVPAVEPDDAPQGPARATPVALRGALAPFDLDCTVVHLGAAGAVFAQVVGASGGCTDRLALDLYAPDGALVGTDTASGVAGCPRIDGRDTGGAFAWARALTAGDYAVCVREATDRRAVRSYVLSLDVSGP